jgi:hypothetical protein
VQRKTAGERRKERRKIAEQLEGAGERRCVVENQGLMGETNESCYFQTKDQLESFTLGTRGHVV